MREGVSEASAVDKAVYNDRLRPFIGFNKDEIERVINDIIAEIRNGRARKVK